MRLKKVAWGLLYGRAGTLLSVLQGGTLMHQAHLKVKTLSHPQILEAQTTAPKTRPTEKALGGTQDTELAQWYEGAYAYYNAVMSGQESHPAEAEWNDFLNQMQWAYQQLWGNAGSNWDINQGGIGDGFNGDSLAGTETANGFQSAPEGAYVGPNGDYIYDLEDANIFYSKDSTPIHSWALHNDVQIPSMGTMVQMALVNDEETGGRKILKVVLQDRYGVQTVMTFDNWENPNFHLNLHMANMENAVIPDELKEKISVEKYKSADAMVAETQVTMNGEPVEGKAVEGEANHYYYEAGTVQDVFEIRPQEGEDETFEVFGNANISVPLSSTVRVEKATDNPEYDYVVVVTHKDGSTDKIYVKDEFKININQLPEYVEFAVDGAEDLDPGQIPSDLQDIFTLNNQEDGSSGNSINPDHPEDTQPVQADGPGQMFEGNSDGVVIYDDPTVNIHPSQDPKNPKVVEVNAEELNITLDSMRDKVTQIVPLTNYYQIIIEFADGSTQIIRVNKDTIKKINFNGGSVSPEEIDRNASDPVFNFPEAGSGTTTDILENLKSATGKNEQQILSALKAEFPQYDTWEKLVDAINSGAFPPPNPSATDLDKIIHFLYSLDPEFSGALNGAAEGWDAKIIGPAYRDATGQLVTLLQTLYPDNNIAVKYPDISDKEWRKASHFTFDGVTYNYTVQSEHHQSEIKVENVGN